MQQGGSISELPATDPLDDALASALAPLAALPASDNPAKQLDTDLRERILSQMESLPPSERPKYMALLAGIDRSREASAVRAYFDVFCFNEAADCFRFEEITRDPGFVSIESQSPYQAGEKVMYWVGMQVRPTLYARLREPFLSRSQIQTLAEEEIRIDEGGTAPDEVVTQLARERVESLFGSARGLWWRLPLRLRVAVLWAREMAQRR